MIKARSQNNLPMGIVVNWTTVTPTKSKSIPVTLLNTNSYNVWIWQSLLTADIVEVEHCPWDFQSVMSHDGNQVQVSFCPVPMPEVQAEIFTSGVASTDSSLNSSNPNMSDAQRNKGRGLNLGLILSSIPQILILRRNWNDFLSQLTWGKWICLSHRRRTFLGTCLWSSECFLIMWWGFRSLWPP